MVRYSGLRPLSLAVVLERRLGSADKEEKSCFVIRDFVGCSFELVLSFAILKVKIVFSFFGSYTGAGRVTSGASVKSELSWWMELRCRFLTRLRRGDIFC